MKNIALNINKKEKCNMREEEYLNLAIELLLDTDLEEDLKDLELRIKSI